jgi:hypothetical protein
VTSETVHEPYPAESDPDYTVAFEEIDGWTSHAWVVRYKGDLIEDMGVYDDEQDAWEAADDDREASLASTYRRPEETP